MTQTDPLTLFLLDGMSVRLGTPDHWEKAQKDMATVNGIFPKDKNPATTMSAIDIQMSSLLRDSEGASKEEFEKFAAECRTHLKKLAGAGMGASGTASILSLSSPPLALASAYGARGDDDQAAEIFESELQRLGRAGQSDQLADAQDEYGTYLASAGQLEAAEKLFRQSLALRQKGRSARQANSWLCLAGLGAIRDRAAESTAAVESAAAAVTKGSEVQDMSSPLGLLAAAGVLPMAKHTDRARYVAALDALVRMVWQLQAHGQYAAADRVADLLRGMAARWLPKDDFCVAKHLTLAALVAFDAGAKEKAVTLGGEANQVVGHVLSTRTWGAGYDLNAEFISGYQGEELENVAASVNAPALLEQELLTEKSFAFRQELEVRLRASLLPPEAPAHSLVKSLAGLRTHYRDLVLANHIGDEINPGGAPIGEITRLAKQFEKRVQSGSGGNAGDMAAELKDAVENIDSVQSMQKKIKAAERQLAASLGAASTGDTTALLAQLTAALPKDAAYVDYVVVDRWTEKIFGATEWCAVVIQPGKPPALAHCASARIVRDQIASYRAAANSAETGAAQDAKVESASCALYASLLAPVEKLLAPGTNTVFVCPDGPLGFIGLGSLLDDGGKFWCEKHDVRFLSDSRALLRHPTGGLPGKVAAFFGDPDFANAAPRKGIVRKADQSTASFLTPEMKKHYGAPTAPAARKNSGPLVLPELPGTRQEVSRLSQSFTDAGWHSSSFLGADASEENLKALHSPTILHIATHGFYLSQIPSAGSQIAMAFSGQPSAEARPEDRDPLAAKGWMKHNQVSPLFLSMIALRGAQTTLRMWCDGQYPTAAGDGILMADEVRDMDLSHTTLVTLSACETGLGESVRGEGSVGIQRALLMAGAHNVLSTLWPIADAETVEFMDAFYKKVIAGEKPAVALSTVQKEFLLKRRKDQGLAAAVNLTAPFVLTSLEQ